MALTSRDSPAHAPNGEGDGHLPASRRSRLTQPALASRAERAADLARRDCPAGRGSSAERALRERFAPPLQRIVRVASILPGLVVLALAVMALAPVPAEAQRPSDDNTLRSLQVTWGSDTYSLSPAFERFRNDYVVVVPADRTEVLVRPTKNHPRASGPFVEPGSNDGTGAYSVALSPGSNIVRISLSAELGHFRQYSLNVFRGGSLPSATLPSGALLTSLRLTADAEVVELPGEEIEGEDCGCATYYRMVVPERVSRLGLFATVSSGARVETQFRTGSRRSGASRNVSLREGRNELIVYVYRTGNQGGRALEVYRLLIIRAGSPPKIEEATVTREGNVLLRYDRTLLPDVPGQRRTPGSAFEVTVNGSRVNVTHTAVTQKWLHLTLARAAGPDAQVRVRYRIPSSNPVRSGKYGLAEEFRNKVARYAGSGLLVFDATANEAPGATVDFKVMMLPAPVRRASVDYATSDDTATAGADYTATSGTLIFEVGEVHKRISVPVIDDSDEDSGETFTLTLSNPINAFVGDATATGTIYNHDPEDLTASFGGVPETHGGEPFVMLLQFTEPVGVGWETMSERLLDVTNGRVAQARRVDRKRDPVTDKVLSALWEITIEPSLGDVTVEVPATADCEAPLAVCTKDGRPLSAAASVTVALEALTATQAQYPSVHDRAELHLEVEFSFPVTLAPEAMRDHALAVTNAELVSVSRAAEDEKRWRFRILPLSNETVTVEIPVPTDCAATGAVCTADGRMLASAVRWEIAPRDPSAIDAAGPEPVSAEVDRAALELVYGEGLDEASVPAPEAFTVTVAGAVRSLAASAPVTVSGRRVFLALASTVAPGDEVTVSYAVPTENRLQDRAGNDAPAVSDRAVTNATPPFTVRFEEGSVPETHDGVNRVAFRLEFSEDPAKLQGRWVSTLLREAVVARIGGDRIHARDVERLGDSGRRHWQMKVRFLGGFALATEDLTIELGPTSDCTDADALCTRDGWKLSNRISAHIRYAPSLSVAGANAVEAAGATLDFPVTLSRVQARRVTVDYATSDGTARAGEDYTGASGTLTFAPGETQKTVSVPVLDDGEAEEAETLTLTLSNPSGAGAVFFTASATGTIEDDEPAGQAAPGAPVTASFSSVPGSHDGTAFAFDLAFSEELAVSAETLRDHAFTVTGGSVTAAEKADAQSTLRWRITVTPSSVAEAVTIALAPKESCEAEGAICTADARALSATVEAEVPGREPTRVASAGVTSGPGENGTWDTGETVVVEVRFSRTVAVNGPANARPTIGITLDGTRRGATYVSGSGTETLRFEHVVTAADDGAARARVVANSLEPDETTLADTEGHEAELGFSVAPHVTSVALVPDASGDRRWTPGETVEVRLTFSEAVTVADGVPTLRVDTASEAVMLAYASGSESTALVFSASVPSGGTGLTELAVVGNSLALNGAGIVAQASGLAADLSHEGTEATQAPGDSEVSSPLTAEFRDVPHAHGGNAFTVELRFSEAFSLSYRTLRDHALAVTGGTLAGVARATKGQDQVWDITVTPVAGAGDVTVTLAATTDCTATGAICAAPERPLSAAVAATVPRTVSTDTAFRVRLADVPDEHDGRSGFTFKVLFNKEPSADYSYVTMRDETLEVRQGAATLAATRARRLTAQRNDRWELTVEPSSKADLTVSVGPFASCSDPGAVCAANDEVLSNAVTRTILGPPGLSVADARVYEAPGAALAFAVTLGRASGSTVTVDYATSDGTAVAGEDYTSASGTLTFAPGETAETVSVPVLDDDHDEGEETLTLTLSNPTGGNAWLADATATGTIENSDAMPRAWLARFGRTVAEQVLEAVEGRFAASRTPGVAVMLDGQTLGGASAEERAALEAREAEMRLEALSDWLRGETDEAHGPVQGSRALTGRELLAGSSFALTSGTAGGGFGAVWGHGAVSRFDGREGDLTLEGEVTSALLGADFTRARNTAGLMLGHARGEGTYRGEGEGEVESTLTGLYPYGRYAVSERVALWGVAGYGEGELVLTPEGQAALETDMDLVMGAVGVRGVAVEAGPQGGLELSLKSDALAVRTSSDAVTASGGNLAAAEAQVTRLKLALAATWRGIGSEGGGGLVPTLEVGVRHDGGDAETGFGLDVGGGLSWTYPSSGLSAELRARGLLTHEAEGFRDRGIAGSLGWDPRPDSERGLSLTLSHTMGAQASGGMDALLGHRHLGGLAANDGGDELANRQLEARVGYGFGVFSDRFTATPEAGLALSDSHHELSLGWRLGLLRSAPVSMELGLTGTRREAANDDAAEPVHALMLRVQLRW